MAKRTLNRRDLRADFDAAERRKAESGESDVAAETEDEEEADETEAGEEEDGEAKVAKKRKPAAKPKVVKTRARAAKVTRTRIVWGVYDNSNRCVATFEYPRRRDAEEMVAKLTAEKKNTHFLQPLKEPLEEKK